MAQDFITPIALSLATATTATLLAFILALYLAWWRVGARGPAWAWVDGLLIVPIALPPTVVGLGLLIVFGRQSPIGGFLEMLGIRLLFSWQATVLAAATVSFPLMYQSIRAAFRAVDSGLADTARLFGYGGHRLLWQIYLPLAWPGVTAGIVLTFMRALGEFGATLMIAGNIPGVTRTAPIALYFSVEAGRIGYALALAGVITLISIGVLIVVSYLNRLRSR
ncbi:MAG: molybdate ABC transporter permease subunit [Opitutales bacterium]